MWTDDDKLTGLDLFFRNIYLHYDILPDKLRCFYLSYTSRSIFKQNAGVFNNFW